MSAPVPLAAPGAESLPDPSVSVVIPARNAEATLARVLAPLAALPADWEVILVDDHSTDRTAEIARAHGVSVIVSEGQRRDSMARNTGARAARGGVLVFLDSDVLTSAEVLQRAVQRLFESNAGCLFGVYDDGAHLPGVVSRYKNFWIRHTTLAAPQPLTWINTSLAVVRRAELLELGGFRSHFSARRGGGDLDFGRRLAQRGGAILADPALEVAHLKRFSLWRLCNNDFRRARGWLRLAVTGQGWRATAANAGVANVTPRFSWSVVAALGGTALAAGGAVSPVAGALGAGALGAALGFNAPFLAAAARARVRGWPLFAPILYVDLLACACGLGIECLSQAGKFLRGRRRAAVR